VYKKASVCRGWWTIRVSMLKVVYKKRQYVGGVQKSVCRRLTLLYTTFYILILSVHHLLHTDSFCTPPSTYWLFCTMQNLHATGTWANPIRRRMGKYELPSSNQSTFVYYRICTLRHIRIEINHGSQNVFWVLTWIGGF
jgi:hypothetical protein